jgi:hypothetical protein
MTSPSSLRTLLARAIDYAGLFPPAALSMEAAVAEYARARESAESWALGRFVVPVGRLEEFRRVLGAAVGPLSPWPVSLTFGGAWVQELAAATAALGDGGQGFLVEAIEFPVAGREELRDRLAQASGFPMRYAELPLGSAVEPLFLELAAAPRAAAKFRTGGLVPDAVPEPEALLWGLATALRCEVPFKCTAGLHHAISGTYPLTDEPTSAVAWMYGYLNLFCAVAALLDGQPMTVARSILVEEDPRAFRADERALRWHALEFGPATLGAVRQRAMHGFGSCSFREPVDALAGVAG